MEKIRKFLNRSGKYWISFVGDSITSTEWVHPNWREIVEYVLKEELQTQFTDWKIPSWGIRCFNWGFDGSTTGDICQKIEEITKMSPDLAIVMIGGNDGVLGVSLNEHKDNVLKILKIAKEKNIDIYYITDISPWNEQATKRYLPYVEMDRDLKINNFIDLYKESEQFPKQRIFTFKSEENPEENIKEGEVDYWHPNQLGNAYIAKVVLNKVFGILFDPEKYIATSLKGEKYPEY